MARNPDAGRNVAIGCFVTPLGAVSGAMVAVLLSMVFAYVTRAPSCSEIPTCDWYVWAAWGALIGGVTLPVLVVRRLLQGRKPGARPDEPAAVPDADQSF